MANNKVGHRNGDWWVASDEGKLVGEYFYPTRHDLQEAVRDGSKGLKIVDDIDSDDRVVLAWPADELRLRLRDGFRTPVFDEKREDRADNRDRPRL